VRRIFASAGFAYSEPMRSHVKSLLRIRLAGAVLAVLCQLVLPVYGMAALPAAGAAGAVPLCTANGIVWIAWDGQPGDTSGGHQGTACPFCFAQGATFIPPPPVAAVDGPLVFWVATAAPPHEGPGPLAHPAKPPPGRAPPPTA